MHDKLKMAYSLINNNYKSQTSETCQTYSLDIVDVL